MSGDLVPISKPNAIPAGLGGPPTLAELAPKFLLWFRFVRERAELTVKSYGEDLQAFLAFSRQTGLTWPGQVGYREIEMYLAWLRHERQLKPASANRHLACLRAFWKWLVREGIALGNPALDVAPVRMPERLPRYLAIDVQDRTLEVLAQDITLRGRRDYCLIAVGLLTGLRAAELATAKVSAVNLTAGVLRVVGKGNKERECVVIPRLAVILRDYLEHVRPALLTVRPRGHLRKTYGRHRSGHVWMGEYKLDGRTIRFSTGTTDKTRARGVLADRLAGLGAVQASPYLFVRAQERGCHFTSHGHRPLSTKAIYQIVRERLRAILHDHVHPHMLRHSFASRLRENGAGLELIAEALGHRDLQTTMIYAHLSSAKRRSDVARFLDGGSTPEDR